MKENGQVKIAKPRGKKLRGVITVAVLGGLIFFGFAFLLNLSLSVFCQAFGVKVEHGWLTDLAEGQAMLLRIFPHFMGLDYFLNHEPSLIKTWLLISLSDGLWFMTILLVFGFIFWFASSAAETDKPRGVK